MDKGCNKDWMDAIREKTLPDGPALSPASWETVGRRVRRSAAIRRMALAAVAALPVLALIFWAPWKNPVLPGPTPVIPDCSLAILSDSEGSPAPCPSPSSNPPSFEDKGAKSGDISSKTAQNEDNPIQTPSLSSNPPSFEDKGAKSGDISSKTAQNEDKTPGEIPGQAGDDNQRVREAPRKAERPRIAVGLRAGTGPAGRTSDVALQSAPFIAALAYLNANGTSISPGVKSNASNTLPFVLAANTLYPEAVNHYTHDLPLTLGLSVRLDLSPRIGVESGLEYAYLHSVEESVAGRLDQRLHFIGIPLRADVSLWKWQRFGLYLGMGVKMEKCVSATLGRISCEEPRLQWSAEAFGGIQYRIGSLSQLYFQPELSYYFTRTDLVTYRTEHPLGVSLHVGLRFDL